MAVRKPEFAWGAVQGSLVVPENVRMAATDAGRREYAEAERQDFCGDPVVWLADAAWHADCAALFPTDAVRALGFELSRTGQFRVYSTHGTEPHIDGDGACFILVLANDGLKFRQGKQAHITNPGEWYIFDDCRTHTVNSAKKSTSYVFLHHALKSI
jgi:hypothetical protein